MKIKYFILSVFVSLLGITSFTNATSVNVSCPGGGVEDICTPNPIFQSSEPVDGMCFNFDTSDIGDYRFMYCLDEDCTTNWTSGPFCVETSFDRVYIDNAGNFEPFNFVISYEGNSGGGDEEENTGTNIVAGGISAFSGIITRLSNIFGEFGPYIIYIAIACIGISLLFKALKYILGFTSNQSKNSIGSRTGMKERRKRRRQQRRKTYDENYINYFNDNNYYYTNAKRQGYFYKRKRKNYKNYQ